MVERVIKRDGRKAVFSERRIREAISAAMRDTGISTYNVIGQITETCVNAVNVKFENTIPTVEQIQDVVVDVLKEMELHDVAENFQEYRQERTINREMKSDVMKTIGKIAEETTRDNANVGNNFSAKLLQIASVANKWINLAKMPKEFSKTHESGGIHIHDLDSYNLTLNCLNIATGEVLDNTFNTGYGTINKPKSIESAAELSCILLQSTQNDMFGGQAHVNFDNDMAEYVDATRRKIAQDLADFRESLPLAEQPSDDEFNRQVEKRVRKAVAQAMQAVCYNLNSMHSRAGELIAL